MKKKATICLTVLLFVFSSIKIFSQVPVITKQPHAQGVIVGQKAKFSVVAIGTGLTYQWYLNDTPIGGATDSVYTTPATTLVHNGNQYHVVVSNVSGHDTSNVVKLYVTAANSRVTASQIVFYNFKEAHGNKIDDRAGLPHPLDLTINNTSSIDWSNSGLLVNGNANILSSDIYATQRFNDSVADANEMTIEMWIRPLTTAYARIMDYGTSESNNNFNVENLPSYGYSFVVRTNNTDSKWGILDTLGLNQNLTHLVFVQSSTQGIQKIYRNGVQVKLDSVKGDLNNWYYLSKLALGSFLDGTYPWKGIFYSTSVFNRALDSVEIAHNFSIGTSGTNMPFVIEQPQTSKVLVGFPATFSVNYVSTTPASFQWQKNGVNISGANGSIYTTANTTLLDSGTVYRIIVTNASGSDTSDNATLIVKSVDSDCPNGITHYYHLDESSSPYRDTVGFSDGTSSSMPSQVAGIVGNSQNFSNEANIEISDNNTFDWKSTESFSLEFWIKTNTTPSGTEVFAGRGDGASSLWWWVGLLNNGHISFQLRNVTGQSSTIGDKDPVVNDNKWHLIAAVRDNSKDKNFLYIDGNKVDSAAINYTDGFDGSTPINLGNLNSSFYYSGSLDEFAIYSVALSQKEMQNHYYKGFKGYGYCETIPSIPAPTNLIASKDNPDSINVKLSWKDNSSNELGFVIQRKLGDSTSVSPFVNIDTAAANSTTYIDTNTVDTTKYTYRLYAYNADTTSAFSNKFTYTTPIPVELTSFTVNSVNGMIQLNWETATEINNAGFRIERSIDNKSFTEISFVKGKGSSTEKSFYKFADKSALSGKYYYRLKQTDFDGTYHYSKSVEVDMGLPKEFSLSQNYPNPFNPSTTIRFALPADSKIVIKIYNTLGQELANIVNKEFKAGVHETTFNAGNLPSGVYFYRIEAKGIDGSMFTSTKRLLLLK